MTGPFAKISPFVRYEFQLASDAFAGTGTETSSHYNKPVTITAP